MKEISLYEAYSLLQQCPVVMLEGKPVEPSLMGYDDEDSNEFMCLSWEEEWDDELLTVEVVFIEGDNQIVELNGCVLSLVNTDGEQEELTLLREFYAESQE